MPQQLFACCYFPSTVMLVDDSQSFLTNLSFELDPKLVYELHDDPSAALDYLTNDYQASCVFQRSLSTNADIGGYGFSNQHTVDVNIDEILIELYNPERFKEVSVIIIDYAMPRLSGLALCEALKDSPIKKIMLTGQADQTVAVEAFNAGIIDKFIMKDDPNLGYTINTAIAELQQRYFAERSIPIIRTLTSEMNSCLNDPLFIDFFYRYCKEQHITEYYLIENSGSFLLVDQDNQISYLIVKNDDDLEMHYEMAENNHAAARAVLQIKTGEAIAYFTQPDLYHKASASDWEENLYPAHRLEGQRRYYYAHVDGHHIDLVNPERITSYQHYQEHVWHEIATSS